MKIVLAGLCASALALASSTVLAGGTTCASESTATVDKVKIIETIHVSSEKEVDETRKADLDTEVLTILKATDSIDQDVVRADQAIDKLEIIETINVTSSKEINANADDAVDADVMKILNEVRTVEAESEDDEILVKDLSASELTKLILEDHDTSKAEKSKPQKSLKLNAIKQVANTEVSASSLDIDQKELKPDTNTEEK